MSSFFTIPAAQKKRKRKEITDAPQKRVAGARNGDREGTRAKATPRRAKRDESISGSDDESDDARNEPEEALTSGSEDEDDGDEEETAAERRLRLAERYLENIKEEVDEVGFDAADIDRDLIAERLQEDAAESKGLIYRKLASQLSFAEASHTLFRNNSNTVTAVALCFPYAYTVSRDLFLTKWRLQDLPKDQYKPKKRKTKNNKAPPPPKKRPTQLAFVKGNSAKAKDNSYRGHTDSILCVAASSDGRFVVTGGRDRKLIVWDAETLKPLKIFPQHRDAVTGLAFRRGTNQLYSSSKDRTVKVWSLNELAYVETLFGHQDEVLDVAALAQERCVSVGARDRTARLWKVVEETQLVFRGGGGEKKSKSATIAALEGSMDRVAMIDEELFVTGSDNGSIALWSIHKKKPVHVLPLAHGVDPPLPLSEVSAEAHPDPKVIPAPSPRWITALATVPYSDVILSGSWDGFVRAWRLSADKRKIERVGIVGVDLKSKINGLSNGVDGLEHVEKVEDTTGIAPTARGVVNDIAVLERGDRGKDGICIVVATGRDHRLGRWQKVAGKNGAVVFEVPRIPPSKTNGTQEGSAVEAADES